MFARQLTKLRKSAGLSQAQLAERLQMTRGQISMYEIDKRSPDMETMQRFADFFGVTVDELLGRFPGNSQINPVWDWKTGKPASHRPNSEYSTNSDPEIVRVPVLGSIRAGAPIEMIREATSSYEFAERDLIHNHDAFILRVKGNSMIGDNIFDGDRVLVIYTPDFSPSDICVVAVDGHDATLKRVKQQGKMCILSPSNPAMDPMFYPAHEVHVIDVVVEVRHRLKR